jgi:hypothetical protein
MKPLQLGKSKKHLRKNRYRFHWYKAMKTFLKNRKILVSEQTIALFLVGHSKAAYQLGS